MEPKGRLAQVLGGGLFGYHGDPSLDYSSWTRPGLMTFAGLETAMTLFVGGTSAYHARLASTVGIEQRFCNHHKIYGE